MQCPESDQQCPVSSNVQNRPTMSRIDQQCPSSTAMSIVVNNVNITQQCPLSQCNAQRQYSHFILIAQATDGARFGSVLRAVAYHFFKFSCVISRVSSFIYHYCHVRPVAVTATATAAAATVATAAAAGFIAGIIGPAYVPRCRWSRRRCYVLQHSHIHCLRSSPAYRDYYFIKRECWSDHCGWLVGCLWSIGNRKLK